MLGISAAELFVIILIGILVVPAKHWPAAAKFLARAIRNIRNMLWKISDASEKIKEQIDIESPIDEIIKTTTNDLISGFSSPIPKNATKKVSKK